MANFNYSLMLSSFLLLLSLQISSPIFSIAISRDNACKSTQFPSYCTTVLPDNDTSTVNDFGRFSVRKSLTQSQKFLSWVQNRLERNSADLSEPAIRALEDCRYLVSLNVDFLRSSIGKVSKTSKVLPTPEADDLQTSLSTVLTNLQTCLDGLETTPSAATLKNDVSQMISNDTKLHSVSLSLCTQGWVPKQMDTASFRSNGHALWRKGRLPMKMSDQSRAIFEKALRRRRPRPPMRKLFQVGDEEATIRDIVVVSQDGSWDFTTINDAIAAAPNNSAASSGYFLIYVTAGVYAEYVNIASNKKYLFLLGDGINQTIITGNRNVVDGWTTFNSATLAVTGLGFLAVNITVRNTAGPSKQQAVALRSGADLSTFYSCSFEAYQDTLYTHSQRQFYRECDIYGTVDFIFGNAAVVIQNCNIYPRLPLTGQFNAITAQGRTDPNQNTGTSIQNCAISPSSDLASTNAAAAAGNGTYTKTYLGRPWKEYSRTVYMQSFMDSFIDPAGWRQWNGDFALSTLYYAEYNNSGPGSDTTYRVNWTGYHVINAMDAANFTVSTFLLGDMWLPPTGVPYTGGLM
ncbi:Pectinesterase inhibitor domain containing protein [Parasponia andersonii]|uniref:Pectinesterase n=1 Tax=Parasponia andersonii TaxID=3476 RepID=A0A2P5CQZ3_PARAD|nr:Pectinesterase inhibitor domain containing protein [Parasponia andersonii]